MTFMVLYKKKNKTLSKAFFKRLENLTSSRNFDQLNCCRCFHILVTSTEKESLAFFSPLDNEQSPNDPKCANKIPSSFFGPSNSLGNFC